MKNLTLITDKNEIGSYVFDTWKTDLFRESHHYGGIVNTIVSQFAWLPRVFADMSNDHLERAHFSTWWGVMMRRDDYTNPYIHDLYWLHEMYHAGHMPYLPNIGKEAFDEKMQRNELEASVLSEIQVYFEMPELRKASFDHPIYADRFLDDPKMQKLWQANETVAIETIRTVRRDVMLSKPESSMDLTEKWIRRFADQNSVFAVAWADSYQEVEAHMADFSGISMVDRAAAGEIHHHWVKTQAAKDPIDNIPFRQEAELFSAFYWANKEKYSKEMMA